MRKVFFRVILMMIIPCVLYASDTHMLSYSDTTSPIEITINQEFALEIDTKSMANYEWQFSKPLDQNMLSLLRTEYKPEFDKTGKTMFVFRAIGQGVAMVSLKYSRSGEKDMYPLDSKTFIVNVK